MSLRVAVAGVWDEGPGYPRSDSLLAALRQLGHEVEICRVPPPPLAGSKTELVARPWCWPRYLAASHGTRRALQQRFAALCSGAAGPPDVVLVPYPGHVAVRWLRAVWDGPLLLDLFLSGYTTAITDRRLFPAWSPPAALLRRLDRNACRAADRVLLDTPQHCAQVAGVTGLPRARFDWVPVVDPEPPARPSAPPPRLPGEPLELLFFGTGVPLHGLPVWIEAVARTPGVRLTLYGGDLRSRRRARVRLGARVRLRAEFAPLAEIRAAIERSHAVCGVVGSSAKARAVVPFKVVHALAHGRPVISGDTPALRALAAPGHDCLVAPVDDPAALAAVLAELAARPTADLVALGQRARQRFAQSFTVAASMPRLDAALRATAGTAADHRPRTAVASAVPV